MASGVYSCPVLAVPPRGYSPLVILAHMLAHPSGRLRRCSLRTYGSTVHLPRLPVGSPSLSLRVDSCTARVTDKRRVLADLRLQRRSSSANCPQLNQHHFRWPSCTVSWTDIHFGESMNIIPKTQARQKCRAPRSVWAAAATKRGSPCRRGIARGRRRVRPSG